MKNQEALFPISIKCSHFAKPSSRYTTLSDQDAISDHVLTDPKMLCEVAEPGLPERFFATPKFATQYCWCLKNVINLNID